jgi:Fur family transcriptional regulator, ferric uptake regulator
MTNIRTSFEAILKEHGYSVTKQRRTLFELLAGQEPLSMHELVKKAAGKMDRASVYRAVEVFEQVGIITRIHIGWKYKLELSDAFAEHHHHLSCLSCKRVIPINAAALESFVDGLAISHKFTPTEHQIEVQGYCENCAIQS